MQTIWKFPIATTEMQVVEMPAGAEILTVATQRGEPFIWAKVETTNVLEKRRIVVSGTGHRLHGVGRYVGTYQLLDGELVFHVFEGLLGASLGL